MRKTFQYRLYPTRQQLKKLEATLEECRWLYNETLAYRKDAWEQRQHYVSWYDSKKRIPILKQERPTLSSVHSQVLQNVTERVELAFQAFFRRCKAGKEPGYPRFKGYGRYDSFTFPQSGFTLTHDNRVCLSKIGSIKMVYHRPIKGQIKTCTVQRSSTGKWYVSFSCEADDGTEIENPRFFRKEEKALAKVQRKHSKLAKGTPERRKHRKVVARVHERITWRRENFTHQESRTIVNSYGVICVEDLQVNRMTHNHCLAKSIADASWAAFFAQLDAKAEEAGRQFVKVNPAYTSQTCSRCGHRQKISLDVRVFNCPCCSSHLDRDLNAALNILALGLQGFGIQSVEAPTFTSGE